MGEDDARTGTRARMADATRAEILAAALAEFAENGLSGARVDAIAARTQTSKRMIYYYFGSKDGLYLAVLEEAYRQMRTADAEICVEGLDPAAAMARIVEATFDYQDAHPDFIRLVCIENIHRARHLAGSPNIARQNLAIIRHLDEVLRRGRAAGVFHRDISAVDLHLVISSLVFFRMSNAHTFGTLFGIDLGAAETKARHRRMVTELVLNMLTTAQDAAAAPPPVQRRG